jgi:hypothetical protein
MMAKRRRKRRKASLGIGKDLSRATRRTTKGVGINEANSGAVLALLVKVPIALALVMVQVTAAIAVGTVHLMGAIAAKVLEMCRKNRDPST